MFLKVMSGQELSDHVVRECIFVEGKRIEFAKCTRQSFETGEPGPVVEELAAFVDGEYVNLTGDAYILNNSGKTIDVFRMQ